MPMATARTPTRHIRMSVWTTWPSGAFRRPRTPSCSRSTRRPARSSGTAAIRSNRGITGAASRWRTAASTSPRSTATCTVSGSRSSMSSRFKVDLAALLFVASTGVAQTPPRHLLIDWAGLTRYGSENAELRLPKPGEDRVVFLGDQVTENWGQGSAKFFPGKPYLNRGIADQTSPQMLVRFRQDVISLHPKVVVIEAGTNDIASVTGPSTEGMIAENFTSMVELAKVNGIRVVLASVLPVCDS